MDEIIVYLDTNVYIGANYIFDKGKLKTFLELVLSGYIKLIYTTTTTGEVESHIHTDLETGIRDYNRVVKKELSSLENDDKYGEIVKKLDECEVITYVKSKFNDFLLNAKAECISLNTIDVEELMGDYFKVVPPFEQAKPYEFKDAIVIKALKEYQNKIKKKIFVVSSDEGFRKAFLGNVNFETFEYIGKIIKFVNSHIEAISKIENDINTIVEEGRLNDKLVEFIELMGVDCYDLDEWDYSDLTVDEVSSELIYIDKKDASVYAHILIGASICLNTYFLDVDNSYYDKEDDKYLFKNYINTSESHEVQLELVLEFIVHEEDATGNVIEFIDICTQESDSSIEISEDTLYDREEISATAEEDDNLTRCSECGKILGFSAIGTCHDHENNPLCSECAVTNDKGAICPQCGRKVPLDWMHSDICFECFVDEDEDMEF